MESTIVTENGHDDAAAEQILSAPILNVADAPSEEDLKDSPFRLAIHQEVNAGPIDPGLLATRVYQDTDKNGVVRAEYTVAFESTHTTVDAPEHLYSAFSGKNVVSVKTDWTDRVLRDMALVKGGTRAYLVLPWTRDKAGFKKVDQRLAGKFRKAAERLGSSDRAAHHRFDYGRFTVMPASDNAPAEIGGYLRIVFTGTRVK